MLERYIADLRSDDPAAEEPAATRERLRARFAPGATRRMTQLGMLLGGVLAELDVSADDALVYASEFGESRALESYLESFPHASPTMFQTSIHPSGVQQSLIGRQRCVGELFPMSGGADLGGQALLTALHSEAPRVIVCGGEERGTWLRDHGVASGRAFVFALALVREPPESALGRLALAPMTGGDADDHGSLSLPDLFDLLHQRRNYDGPAAPGWRLALTWP